VIKRTRFSKTSRASLKRLIDRCDYIQDAGHPNHTGKIIHPAVASGCSGIKVDDFLTRVLDLYGGYERSRAGKKGNRTTKLFEEFVYSSPADVALSKQERQTVREELRQRLWSNVPILAAWHEDPLLGRSDLHFLTGAHTDSDPPLVYTSASYGHGKKHIALEMERAEDQVLLLLNRQRARERWILSARETKRLAMAKAGKKTLAQRLAKVWDGKRETLKEALRKLGYLVLKLTAKTVRIALNAWSRPRQYVIATLELGRLAELKALAKERIKPRDAEMGGP
jgi:hypothetical protein